MSEPIKVLVLGTGQMGSGIVRLILRKQGLELAGAYARRSHRAGMDIGAAIGLEREVGIAISNDLAGLIERTRPDVAIQATCSTLADACEEIKTLLYGGVHVISIAEEMAYPASSNIKLSVEIDQLATARSVAVVGTGINPGFALDFLVTALTSVCSEIESIVAERVNDLAPYGPSVLSAQGVGLTAEEFTAAIDDGTVVGHRGFTQSVHLIADAIGWRINRIEETRKPIISMVERKTASVAVEPGRVAGCLHTATAYREDRPVIRLIHPQQICPHLEGVETGDSIEIIGKPHIRWCGKPEIPGGEGTVAIAVNTIPRVLCARPGLHTMLDLPAPAAMLGDARELVRAGN